MNFPTNISKYLKVNEQGFIICTGKTITKQLNTNLINQGSKMLAQIINQLGQNSAKSQGLKQIITSMVKFSGTDHRIYIKVEDNKAIGFIRTGEKKLFYHDNMGHMKELNPTCVLDIYVHQNYQRTGNGKEIFEFFLKYEDRKPEKLAYDRPSSKLIGFLKKHYGLSKFIAQNNNFVIFDQYFSSVTMSNSNKTLPLQKLKKQQPPITTLTNRFYKPQTKPIQKPSVLHQNKNLNKTLNLIICQPTQQKPKQKIQKIQDSLSLLEKQMNRMQVKNPVMSQGLGKNMKTEITANYHCPWATEQNLIFRTTSNSYGSHYNRYK